MAGTALASRSANGALAHTAADELWSDQQKRELKQLLLKDKANQVSDAQLAVFAEVCKRTGLDPFLRQLFLLPTTQGLVIHIAIDGLRQIAIRDGQFDAQDGPYWCGKDGRWRDVWLDDGAPAACKVGVKRRGSTAFTYAVVTYREFKGSSPNWTQKAAHMLAIRAEGHALRKAFQGELSGVQQTVRAVPGAAVDLGDEDMQPLPVPAAPTRVIEARDTAPAPVQEALLPLDLEPPPPDDADAPAPIPVPAGATQAQLDTIGRISRQLGKAVDTHGLTRGQASEVITRLKDELDQAIPEPTR